MYRCACACMRACIQPQHKLFYRNTFLHTPSHTYPAFPSSVLVSVNGEDLQYLDHDSVKQRCKLATRPLQLVWKEPSPSPPITPTVTQFRQKYHTLLVSGPKLQVRGKDCSKERSKESGQEASRNTNRNTPSLILTLIPILIQMHVLI